MDKKELGCRVKLCRKSKKLTQEKLAEQINVSPHYIYEIERGNKMMSLSILVQISQALNVSTDYLLFGQQHASSLPADELAILIDGLSYENRKAITKMISAIIPCLKQ